jgi:hypothetical protein
MPFTQYYRHYLSLHQNPICRRLHVLGLLIGVAVFTCCVLSPHWRLRLFAPLLAPAAGYAFAWIGHFFFEHNTPATWKNPVYAFRADLNMTWDVLRGRIKL